MVAFVPSGCATVLSPWGTLGVRADVFGLQEAEYPHLPLSSPMCVRDIMNWILYTDRKPKKVDKSSGYFTVPMVASMPPLSCSYRIISLHTPFLSIMSVGITYISNYNKHSQKQYSFMCRAFTFIPSIGVNIACFNLYLINARRGRA